MSDDRSGQERRPQHPVAAQGLHAFGGQDYLRELSPMNHDCPITRGLELGVLDDVGLTALSVVADEGLLVDYKYSTFSHRLDAATGLRTPGERSGCGQKVLGSLIPR